MKKTRSTPTNLSHIAGALFAAGALAFNGCMFVALTGADFDPDEVDERHSEMENARLKRQGKTTNQTEYDALQKQTTNQGIPPAPTMEDLEAEAAGKPMPSRTPTAK